MAATSLLKGLLLCLVLLFLLSCRRENVVFAVEPQIEFESLQPAVVQEFGTLVLTLRYKDGDGDLGGQPDNQPDLFLIDLRDSTLFPAGYDGIIRYNMPKFYEGPTPQSIQGTIEVSIPGIIRLNPNAAQEQVQFRVYILDRAGHRSNDITTSIATIVP